MEYWMNGLYADTQSFNELAGNHKRVNKNAFQNQLKLILEEADELRQAVEDNNLVEILDAVVDLYVVINGMTSKLEDIGVDVSGALYHTAMNNLSKFPTSEEVADATVEHYSTQGIAVTKEFNSDYNRWVIRDGNGKVRKPVGYESNDLTRYVGDVHLQD